jgi:uncharacterized protein (DUF983 family)
MSASFTCPGCGEERLVDLEGETWACRVCGKQGARVLRLVASDAPAPTSAPNGQLHALLVALVQRHLTPGTWQVVAIAPIAQWPRGLQRELTATLSAGPESVVLVLERVPS